MQTQNPHIDLFGGKKIRLKRKMLGMSQKTLGQHLGVTFQQIQKYEKGLNRVSAGRLKEISDILNVPLAFFYTDIIKKENAPYHHEEIASSKEEFLLLKNFRILPSVKQKAILKLISDQD
ncbi:helix-turn-helix domain-containing protein [Bartonella queenslandensis]|uniref:helix-turn-helix domain-containing protein n=1 Tax=Bartonella queenslandensis TaxID=481138 RepID=UPI001BA5EE33|nr:helix-turn-helix transcriptional regulator [Bartonella queenslandensis]